MFGCVRLLKLCFGTYYSGQRFVMTEVLDYTFLLSLLATSTPDVWFETRLSQRPGYRIATWYTHSQVYKVILPIFVRRLSCAVLYCITPCYVCYVMGGSLSRQTGHIRRFSDLFLSASFSLQRQTVPVRLRLTRVLPWPGLYRSVLVMPFFTPNWCIQHSDVKFPLSKSSSLPSSQRALKSVSRHL